MISARGFIDALEWLCPEPCTFGRRLLPRPTARGPERTRFPNGQAPAQYARLLSLRKSMAVPNRVASQISAPHCGVLPRRAPRGAQNGSNAHARASCSRARSAKARALSASLASFRDLAIRSTASKARSRTIGSREASRMARVSETNSATCDLKRPPDMLHCALQHATPGLVGQFRGHPWAEHAPRGSPLADRRPGATASTAHWRA